MNSDFEVHSLLTRSHKSNRVTASKARPESLLRLDPVALSRLVEGVQDRLQRRIASVQRVSKNRIPQTTRSAALPLRHTRLARLLGAVLASTISAGALAAVALTTGVQTAGATGSSAEVYVANQASGTVSVISTTTNSVIATIPVGGEPLGVAATPNGQFVYVADGSGGNVSVISSETNGVVATISVPGTPEGIAVSPDGSTVYVADGQNSDTVSVIATASNTVTGTIEVGNFPVGVAVSPDGSTVYVTNYQDNSVSVISTATDTVTSISGFGAPYGVAVSPDGSTLYVADLGDNTVSVVSTATDAVTSTINVGQISRFAALTPDGSTLYVGSESNSISAISTTTDTPSSVTVANTSSDFGVAVTPDGSTLYVTDTGGDTVNAISTAGNTEVASITVGSGPFGLAIAEVPATVTDTVAFNSEGGSAVANITGTDGSTITLPAAPAYVGYTFDGWFAAPTGGTALTSPYTLNNDGTTTTLYAQWTDQYTPCAVSAGTSINDCNFENPVLSPDSYLIDPSGSAWTFTGENGITNNGSGFTFQNPSFPGNPQLGILHYYGGGGTTSQVISGWQANTEYTLTMSVAERCESYISSNTPTFQLSLDGQVLGSYTATTCTLVDTSFSFSTTAGTHTLTFTSEQGSNVDTSTFITDLRLTASATTPLDTVAFTSDGGAAVANITGNDGTSITLPGDTQSGYTFNGWFTAATGGTLVGAAGASYTLNNNGGTTTLFAQWSPIIDTVAFNSEGGSAVANITGPNGSTITLPAAPTRTGYTFNGWFTAATGGTKATSPYTLNNNGTTTTLYAQWTVDTDTVAFNSEGGSAVANITGPNGSTITLPAAPTRTGYTFNGWFAAPTGGTALTSPYTLSNNGTTTTLYAQWTVVLVTLLQGNPTSATVAYGAGYSGTLSVSNAIGTPSFTVTSSVSGITVSSSGAISASTSLAVGHYTVSGNDADTHGDSGTWSFALTINQALLSVSANSVSRLFGQANPSLVVTITGFVNGQTLATSGVTGSASCSTTATTTSVPGTYPITCAIGALAASNYGFTFPTGSTLTVTATSTVSGNSNGNLDVGSGQVLDITSGAALNGNVTVSSGGAVVMSGGTLQGQLQLTGGIAEITGGNMSGNVLPSAGSTFTMLGGTLTGNVQAQGSTVTLSSGHVQGNVSDDTGPITIGQATIAGNVESTSGPITIAAGSVGGNVQNSGPIAITGGTVAGNVVNSGQSGSGSAVSFCEASISGNLQVQNDTVSSTYGINIGGSCGTNTIKGNLQVLSNTATGINVDLDTVGGSLTISLNTVGVYGISATGDTVTGTMTVQQNTGSGTSSGMTIEGNTVKTNMVVQQNIEPFVSNILSPTIYISTNNVSGNLQISSNSWSPSSTFSVVQVLSNTVGQNLSCTNDTGPATDVVTNYYAPPPNSQTYPNTVYGQKQGECASL